MYLNAGSLERVTAGWRALLGELDQVAVPLEGAVLDLEPDLRHLDGLYRGRPGALAWLLGRRPDHDRAVASARALNALLSARAPVLAAVPPTQILGPLGPLLERRLGLPVTGVDWGERTEMTYTSFLLPWLRGLGSEVLAWRLAGLAAGPLVRAHVKSPGRTSAILGTCGIGTLGDEPCFPHAEAMRTQVRAAAQAQPHALGVFNLLGLVSPGKGYRPGLEPDEDRWRRWAKMLREELTRTGP